MKKKRLTIYTTRMPDSCYDCGSISCDEEGDCWCIATGEPIDLYKSFELKERDARCPLVLMPKVVEK